MQKSTKAKILTGIATATLAVASLFTAQQREPNTILDKDDNIQYTYTDQNSKQVYGVLDNTQALSAYVENDSIVEKTSMYIAYQDDAPPPEKHYLPVITDGELLWPANGDRLARWIPAPGGVSTGHPNITYGTIGDQVTYNGNTNCFLTNAHVANGIDGGKVGDPMYQPGPYNGGTETIGYIVAMVTPRKNVTNTVDAAVVCGKRGDIYPGIYGIGRVNGIYEDPYVGMVAVKCGATSGCTVLTLEALDVSIKIGYVKGKNIVIRTFAHQMMWVGKGMPGDSGSVIVAMMKMVSELFAGNEEENRVIGNDPVYLLKALPGLAP